jgi:hypothetical protein
VLASNHIFSNWGWRKNWEAYCVCGHCDRGTIFVLSQDHQHDSSKFDRVKGQLQAIDGVINSLVSVEGFISVGDIGAVAPPEHLPENVLNAFKEGAKCLAVGCFNAAGTMFRLCVDMASTSKLPQEDVAGLNKAIRRSLGLRLPWLFDNHYLPDDLRQLSHCIKEDGNDGAHEGTLTEADALDLLDFTTALLERIYTQPEKVRLAGERRSQRRT